MCLIVFVSVCLSVCLFVCTVRTACEANKLHHYAKNAQKLADVSCSLNMVYTVVSWKQCMVLSRIPGKERWWTPIIDDDQLLFTLPTR